MSQDEDEFYMKLALNEAQKAYDRDEVPIGAVLVDWQTQEIIAQNSNRTIESHDATAHAEILVLREAGQIKRAQRFPECDLYVTLEPCPMCTAAISFARIRRLVIGAKDLKSGGLSGDLNLYSYPQMHHKPNIIFGVCESESSDLLKKFFQQKRKK
jgi:tRNA(adenine34) deaminase